MIPLIVIEGPTASGKTALAIELARRLDTEIISADSRQVYRHMDIGTAKPSSSELEAVPHHLISIIEPSQSYNVGLFARTRGRWWNACTPRVGFHLSAAGRECMLLAC
jgi:tRNA dimethylallyltransferase